MTIAIRWFEDLAEAERWLVRPRQLPTEVPEPVRERIRDVFGEELSPLHVVERILQAVRERGDEALRQFTLAFDGCRLEELRVSEEEFALSRDSVSADVLEALCFARERIERFHRRTLRHSWIEFDREGALGQLIRPVECVGIYVPGDEHHYHRRS